MSQASVTIGRVGVLMGGPSAEREISLKSGRAVCAALEQVGCCATAIEVSAGADIETALLTRLRAASVDVAFIALHGTFGEDGGVQRLLDREGLPYIGSSAEASAVAMDKVAARVQFEAAGLSIPRGIALRQERWADGAARPELMRRIASLGEPVVVKPSAQGSSIGVQIVPSSQAALAIDGAFSYGSVVLVEEYVTGRELTVGMLEDQPLPVIEIVPSHRFFDFTAKYQAGMTEYRVPAPIDAATARAVQDAASAAHRALGCRDCSRVDLILTPAGLPAVLEVNTIPGFTGTSLLPKAAAAAGIAFPELCLRLVRAAVRRGASLAMHRVEVGADVASI